MIKPNTVRQNEMTEILSFLFIVCNLGRFERDFIQGESYNLKRTLEFKKFKLKKLVYLVTEHPMQNR